jgi:hypothetical protein
MAKSQRRRFAFGFPSEKQKADDASRFEDIFKVMATPEVEGALLSARRRKQGNDDDSDSDNGGEGAADGPTPLGSLKAQSRRRHASSRHSAHTSGSSASLSRRKPEQQVGSRDSSRRRAPPSSGVATAVAGGSTVTPRTRSATVTPVDGAPAPPPGLPPGVQPIAVDRESALPVDGGSLSDNAPSPRRRRHHHSARRRAELAAEIADCKRALSDPNTPDMAPWRARLTKAETELRELEHAPPAIDDTFAIVAAAATAAAASGTPLPESQQEMIAKAQMIANERQAQAQLATAALVSPRRRRGNTTNTREVPTAAAAAAVITPAKSPADAIRELKIRKMVLAGQIGAMKKQQATLAAGGEERKRVDASLKSVEAELAKLDEDIKQLSAAVETPATTVPIQKQ